MGPPHPEPRRAPAGPLLRGISTGDFKDALAALLGRDAPSLSPSVIARLTADCEAEYERWQTRDLSARRYVYVWAAGFYLQARMEEHAECMLVPIGATPEGKTELVGFQVGVRESPSVCLSSMFACRSLRQAPPRAGANSSSR